MKHGAHSEGRHSLAPPRRVGPKMTLMTSTDTTVSGLGSTYFYVLQSTFSSWTSANTAEASGTTPGLCL